MPTPIRPGHGPRFEAPEAEMPRSPVVPEGLHSPAHSAADTVSGSLRASPPSSPRPELAAPRPSPRHTAQAAGAAELPPVPADVATLAPVRLTSETLAAWEHAEGISKGEQADRVNIADRIRAACSGQDILETRGDLDLKNFLHLTALPEGLVVRGILDLSGCGALAAVPQNLRTQGLSLDGCAALTTLPEGLVVNGLLDISRSSLITTPPNLQVDGFFRAEECSALTTIGAGLRVGRDAFLYECHALEATPADMRSGTSIVIMNCRALETLGPNLRVGGTLLVQSCPALTTLSPGATLGELALEDCPAFTTIGEGLHINESMSFAAVGIRSLPEGLTIGSYVSLLDCEALSALPSDITQWGPASNGSVREVFLERTGLSAEVLSRLRDADVPGMRFEISMPAALDEGFSIDVDAVRFWETAAREHQPAGEVSPLQAFWLAPENVDPSLQTFLSRLRNTAEYQNASTRQALAQRVVDLLTVMQADPELRAQCLALIAGGLESCDDRVILVMNQLEMAVKLHRANQAGPEALRDLGLQMMRQEVVDAHARKKCETLQFVDEIEVHLAYHTGMPPGHLPGSTRNMLYRGISGVTQKDLDEALAASTRYADSAGNQVKFFADWAPWQVHLRREFAEQHPHAALPELPDVDVNTLRAQQCPITGAPYDKLEEPLVVWSRDASGAMRASVFEHSAFMQWWIDKGTNPETTLRVSESELFRPQPAAQAH